MYYILHDTDDDRYPYGCFCDDDSTNCTVANSWGTSLAAINHRQTPAAATNVEDYISNITTADGGNDEYEDNDITIKETYESFNDFKLQFPELFI